MYQPVVPTSYWWPVTCGACWSFNAASFHDKTKAKIVVFLPEADAEFSKGGGGAGFSEYQSWKITKVR